ncbi:MAG: HdeD family acid-resistance protein [Patescibacteria group bacterium]
MLALGSLVFTTLLSLVFLGWILTIAGIAQLIQLFWSRDSGSFLAHFVSGLLALVVGILIVFNPGAGAVVVTFLLSIFFIVSGLVHFFTALSLRRRNWGWSALYGIV